MKKTFTAYRNESENQPIAFDLECTMELETLEVNGSYVVIDSYEKRLYTVQADSHETAVQNYINWYYGQVRLWKYDEEERGYCESDEFVQAATQYTLEENDEHWELVEG